MVLFSRKANKPVHFDLHFNDTLLSPVTDHKPLSLTLSDYFRWKAYITSSVNKAWQSLRLLRFITYLLNRRYLQRLHVTFIRPLLEYGDIIIIWDCFEQMKTGIESVQVQAAGIITVATKYCTCNRSVWCSG